MTEVRLGKAPLSWSHLNEGKEVKTSQTGGIATEMGTSLGDGKDDKRPEPPEVES